MTAIITTSVITNLVVKPVIGRRRPAPPTAGDHGRIRMPRSRSFPSGHTASAFAFATAVGADLPALSFPLDALAAAVGYSRVHLGVHYPSDVIVGAVLGSAVGTTVRAISVTLGPPAR